MITYLGLRQFRNYKDSEFNFNNSLVIITGPNASGKTNILEAIYISSLIKSFRVRDRELIMHDKDFYVLNRKDSDENEINIKVIKNAIGYSKKILLNNTKTSISTYTGSSPVVLFEPNDLNMLVGLPSMRREYLDSTLSQTDKKYLSSLRTYKKIITQKNSLLRRAKREIINNIKEQLFVYNIQLVESAIYLIEQRQIFIESILKEISNNYRNISHQNASPKILYTPLAKSKEEFITKTDQSIDRDISAGMSTFGPHRDDFNVEMKGHRVNEVASRGELRSLVLALKIAEANYIEKKLKKRPILLLDDVLSELDEDRQKFLLENIKAEQTFITTTHLPANLQLDYQNINLPL